MVQTLCNLNFLGGLRHSFYILPVRPLLSVIFQPKKEKQEGSVRADLMGSGIAICHSRQLDTYKWRGNLNYNSLESPGWRLLLCKKEHDITNLANVADGIVMEGLSRERVEEL